MTKKERYRAVIEWFVQHMPVAESELRYETPYQLVVAVILSAQCTDKRVNMVTPLFFEKFPDASTLSEASEQEIFDIIKSVTYPNNKSKSLLKMARMLTKEFSSVVPSDPLLLQKLPGVGRKTANVIASVIYNIPVIAVDTHVYRISRRLGLSTATTPLGVELDLTENIPEHLRATAHHWLILHGRYVCVARKPKCSSCGLSPFCLQYHKTGGADLHKGGSV